jgi:hypothetical protein
VRADRLCLGRERLHGAYDLPFGAAQVQHQARTEWQGGQLANLAQDGAHRRGEHDHVRARHPLGQVGGGALHGAGGQRLVDGLRPAGHADHFAAQAALGERQPQRAAHQTQAHDGDAGITQ